MVLGAAGAVRLRSRDRHVHGDDPGPRRDRASEPRRGRRGPVAERDRLPRPPRQHRLWPRGKRQRLGDGSARRARSCLRPGCGRRRRPGATEPRSGLRLDRRRCFRRTRRRSVRRDVAVCRGCARSDQPGRDRRRRRAANRHRGRSTAIAVGFIRAHRRRPRPGGVRPGTAPDRRALPAPDAWLSVHARRAGPARCSGRAGLDAEHRPDRGSTGSSRRRRSTRPGSPSWDAPRKACSARSTPDSS